MKLSDAQVVRGMQLLQLSPTDFKAIEQSPSFPAAQQALEALKERARKQFRRAAMDLHPDRTNNDPAKTEDFKLVSSIADAIGELQVRPPPPPRPMPSIRIVFRSWGVNATTTTSTATTTYWGF